MRAGEGRGFTVPELLVVIIVLAAMLGGAMWLLRPASYEAAEYEAERRLGMATIGQALKLYKDRNGQWPEGVPAKATAIASHDKGYDLCPFLVPKFINDMPLDPVSGMQVAGDDPSNLQFTDQRCDQEGITYVTGFTIKRNKDDSLTLSVARHEKITGPTSQLRITVR